MKAGVPLYGCLAFFMLPFRITRNYPLSGKDVIMNDARGSVGVQSTKQSVGIIV